MTPEFRVERARARGRYFPAEWPRFVVVQLLIWTVATASLWNAKLAGHSQAFRIIPPAVEQDWSQRVVASAFVFSLLDDAVFGIGICGLVFGVFRVMQRQRFFHHPGHWILAATGTIGILAIVVSLLGTMGVKVEHHVPYARDYRVELYLSLGVMAVTQIVVYRIAMYNCESGSLWDFVFFAFVFQGLLKLLAAVYSILMLSYWRAELFWWFPWSLSPRQMNDVSILIEFFPYCVVPIIALAFGIALIGDRHATGRDWPHWVGVFVGLWITLWGLLAIASRLQFVMEWFA